MSTGSRKPSTATRPAPDKDQPSESQLDEALEESFPASDPIAVSVPADSDKKKHPSATPKPAKKP